MSLLRCIEDDGAFNEYKHNKLKRKRRQEACEALEAVVNSCIALAEAETKELNTRIYPMLDL